MPAIISSSKNKKNKPYLVPYLLLFFSTFGILYLFSIFNTASNIDSVEEVEQNIEYFVNKFPEPAQAKQNYNYAESNDGVVDISDFSEKIWYPGKNVSYHDIPNFIQEHLKQNPLNNKMPDELRSMLKIENIQPWKILNLDPEHTLLPFIHIPKTAGSSVKDAINDWGYLNKNWPYKNSLYPRSANSYFGYKTNKKEHPQVKSHNSPGCREAPFGGTHCSYSELEECFEKNWANLMPNMDDYMYVWRNFYVKYPGKRSEILKRPADFWDNHTISKMRRLWGFEEITSEDNERFNQSLIGEYTKSKMTANYWFKDTKSFGENIGIKYFSVIRHPVTRMISEYYWWLPKTREQVKNCKRNNFSWKSMCETAFKNGFEHWLYKVPAMKTDNTALNRQTKSLYPMEVSDREEILKHYVTYRQDCANFDGLKGLIETKTMYGKPVGSSSGSFEINADWQIAIDTIKNVEENFAFILILDELQQSYEVLKKVLRYQQDYDEDKTTQKSERNKRTTHTSKHPDEFPAHLLVKIVETNQLDMVVFDYFTKKLKVTKELFNRVPIR